MNTKMIKRIVLGAVLTLGIWTVLPVKTYAQQTESQRKLKKTKKKRMRDSRIAEKSAKGRHLSIQTKETRKRMKKHLKQTKKHIERYQHGKE